MSPHGGIVIVGPCAAGKSTLAAKLSDDGRQARQVAQEHSYVPNMWQLLSKPDVLIFLDASFEACSERKSLDWTPREYGEQQARLAHAREHSDLLIETDGLTPDQVFEQARAWLAGGQASRQPV